MAFLTAEERLFLQKVSGLAYCNIFSPQRVEYERQLLGDEFDELGRAWSLDIDDPDRPLINDWKVNQRVKAIAGGLRDRLVKRSSAPERELVLYEDAVLFLLYHHYVAQITEAALETSKQKASGKHWQFYRDYVRDWTHYFDLPGITFPTGHEPAHTFACYFQIRRAFLHIFHHIVGSSPSVARLRAAVWQSIFTHDIRRYRRTLYARMGDFATLITGPSGTGKELVARAIALSRYIPFDEAQGRFPDGDESFYPINLAALSPTLIESELFGHRRGAFTGAVENRKGWLETCPALGCVFLDEIGDLDPSIQVKLLRVIETRTFQPVGDTTSRQFHGKIIAATNRDLSTAMREGNFREDLYYRLCSDQIMTPPLQSQVQESPDVLHELIFFTARKVAGDEAETLAPEVERWVKENLGRDYAWPGNYRELEQCVRNFLIRREYRPSRGDGGGAEALIEKLEEGNLTAEQVLSYYATLVYAKTGSYQETARRLQLDRRTVKSKIDPGLLDQFGPAAGK
jgi:DNA-binding NtrC family response regulator